MIPPALIAVLLLLLGREAALAQAAVATEPAPAPYRVPPADSVIAAAADALGRGLPWRASRMLDAVVRDSTRRTPDAVLLAASAAGRWGGWAEVQQLLGSAPWLDTLSRGAGRLLLARAALERGDDSMAQVHAAAAIRDERDAEERGRALVLLARALERLGARDSAAASYDRAARKLPAIADWLRLRAAGVTLDSAARAARLAAIANPAARNRIPYVEASLRERIGDFLSAASRYEALSLRALALRMRLNAMGDSAGRAAIRRQLVALLARQAGAGETRVAIGVLDSAFAPLSAAEELVVARAAAAAGVPARAAPGYARALAAGLGTPEDRFDYATALGRIGKYRESALEFARVPAGHKLGGAAAYQRARALLRDGQRDRAERALGHAAARFPQDTAAATPALMVLADLAADDRRESEARRLLLTVARRFPASRFAPVARLRAGLIALTGGDAGRAALEFDSLAASRRAGDEALAATYWAGRAWAQQGDTVRARQRWEALTARDPTSYYAGLSEQRLGVKPWSPPGAADSFPVVPALDSAMERAATLERLGLADEATWEYEQLARDADQSPDRLLATAAAFRSRGLGSQGIRLARRALARGAPADARLYRLLYPVVQADALLAEAAGQGLDPALVAALIRQESMFNPAATSSAGARGLMQVMPDLGRMLASSLGLPAWDPVLLYQPDVNLQLGTIHLADLVRRYDHPARFLAAYNAGVSRVDRWQTKAGMDDPEVFTDLIPFVETRDYVRIIRRNQDIYRALYSWGAAR